MQCSDYCITAHPVNIGYKEMVDMTDLNIDQYVKDPIKQLVANLSANNYAKAEEA